MSVIDSKLLTAIQDVDDKINKFKGKWVSILGDSISTYEGWIPEGNATFYPRGDVDDVKKTWWHQLLTKLGAKLCVNQSWSGRKVCDASSVASATQNALRKLHRVKGQEYINIDGTKEIATANVYPDVILVMLGVNDFNAGIAVGDINYGSNTFKTDSFSDSYSATLMYMPAFGGLYPNSSYYIMNMCYASNVVYWCHANAGGSKLMDYRKCIEAHAYQMEFNVIHVNRIGVFDTNINTWTIDKLHPKANMMAKIAQQCYSEMIGSNCIHFLKIN